MIKKRVNELAKITDISCSDALREFNESGDTEMYRVTVSFRYLAKDNDEEDEDNVFSLLSSCINDSLNGGNIIIDIAAFDGDTLDDKIDTAKEKLLNKHAPFSTYVVDIADLNEEGYTMVNNGEREYSSLSQHFLGNNADEEGAVNAIRKRLNRQIDEGTLEFGEIEEEKSKTSTSPARKRR